MKENELFNAPPLPKLKQLSGTYMLNVYFTNGKPNDKTVYGFVMNFIVLVDNATFSYKQAREAMLAFTNTHESFGGDQIIIASSHFDTCIQSIVRAQKMAKGIVKCKKTPIELKKFFPPNGKIIPSRKLKPIISIRNSLQHFDRDLLKGKISPTQAVGLFPKQYSLELGPLSVAYTDLIQAIEYLHPIAKALSKYREN